MTLTDRLAALAQRCQRATHTAHGWTACCPAHDDSTPSLALSAGREGGLVVHCHAGCSVEAVLAALGMPMADLAPAPRANGQASGAQIVATYDYHSATGAVLFQTVRMAPKTFRQRQPDPITPGQWTWNLAGVETVLYHLPLLLATPATTTVYVVEGEKDVETLTTLGLVATCNPMGAGKWQRHYSETLRGRRIVILPDNDAPGQAHAAQVAHALAGIALQTQILELPGLPAKGDVTDWVHAGGTREALDALAAQASADAQREALLPFEGVPFEGVMSAQALFAQLLTPVHWIVPDILPAGVTLMTGRAKDGKSMMAWNLCVAVATGGTALGSLPVEAGDVLYFALEDGARRAQTRLKAQMTAAGMAHPPARLWLKLDTTPRLGAGFEAGIARWLADHPAARLIVIDILEHVRPKRQRGGSVYEDDTASLAALRAIALTSNVAMLVLHHSNKGKHDDSRDTISGSTGLSGAADTLWILSRRVGEHQGRLQCSGRDLADEHDLALSFEGGFWTLLGTTEDVDMSHASKEVLSVLTSTGVPHTPKQLAAILGKKDGTVRLLLTRMAARGQVLNLGAGRYVPNQAWREPDHRDRGVRNDAASQDKQALSIFSSSPPLYSSTPPTRERERESIESVLGVTTVSGITCVAGVSGVTMSSDFIGSGERDIGGGEELRGVTPLNVTYEHGLTDVDSTSSSNMLPGVTGVTGFGVTRGVDIKDIGREEQESCQNPIPPTPPPAHVEALADVYTTEWKDHIEPSLWDADPEYTVEPEEYDI